MGTIIASFFISLDGVVESPEQWHLPYFDDEMGAFVGAGMEGNRAFLMGRTLYDEWSAYWPTSDDEQLASYFNDIPKYVISSSLTDPQWSSTTVVPGDVAAVRRVKESVDGDISMAGSATTVRWLLAHGLLDELRLLVHPVVVGEGRRLFEGSPLHKLELTRSTTFSSGVLSLTYVQAG